MCGSNPELSPEVNSAKCIGGTALGFAIVTLVGLAIVPWGTVSAFAGIFGTIAGGIVCCCGPKTKGEGAGKMNAAGMEGLTTANFNVIREHLYMANDADPDDEYSPLEDFEAQTDEPAFHVVRSAAGVAGSWEPSMPMPDMLVL